MKQKENGFTLIEILAALVLFSIIFFPLGGLLVSESKLQRKYEDKQCAVQIAKSEIEKVKGCAWPVDDKSYQVEMAGHRWDVNTTVKKDSGMTVLGTEIIQPQYIAVKVSRENDTLVLADFAVLKETYK
jgi:prepilin-type N-terminal cleavage/methylation domain-containing protein